MAGESDVIIMAEREDTVIRLLRHWYHRRLPVMFVWYQLMSFEWRRHHGESRQRTTVVNGVSNSQGNRVVIIRYIIPRERRSAYRNIGHGSQRILRMVNIGDITFALRYHWHRHTLMFVTSSRESVCLLYCYYCATPSAIGETPGLFGNYEFTRPGVTLW